jgi:hypothetical protein
VRPGPLVRRGSLDSVGGLSVGDGYGDLVLAHPALVGYWRLGEASGPFEDLAGAVDLTAGYDGGMPGNRGYTSLLASGADASWRSAAGGVVGAATDDFFFDGTAPFSVEFLYHREGTPTAGANMSRQHDTNSSDLWSFVQRADGTVRFIRGSTISTAAAGWVNGTTYHVCGTYDGANMRFYRSATLIGGPTAAGSRNGGTGGISASALRIGPGAGLGYTFVVDEFAIYSDDLDLATIQAHSDEAFAV